MKVGIIVRCTVCGNMKKPLGRAGVYGAHHCDDTCPGYRADPRPGSLWPGETEEEFGYLVNSDGTAKAQKGSR